MLPRSVYQSLPYLYISLGLICMLFVESRLIFFSSTLLITAGALVLWMRRMNSVEPEEYINSGQIMAEEAATPFIDEDDERPDYERRIGDERAFPLVDDNGGMIAFDRRADQSDKAD
ncbi:hypothetical protein ACFL3P_01200 [Pseudomonadota bacterium]